MGIRTELVGIAGAAARLTKSTFKAMRYALTGGPSSLTPESHNAWLSEQVQAYGQPHPYAGPLTNDNFTGETYEMRLAYRRWSMKEPPVKAALLTKCLAVCQLDPQVLACNKKRPRDREAAEFFKWSVEKSVGGFPKLLMNMLLPALIDGYSLVEPVLDVVDVSAPDYAGHWTLKAAKGKDTQGIRFSLDQFKNITGVLNMAANQGGQALDPREFLIFSHLSIFENPFGISDLRAANRAASMIEAAIKLRQILLENFSGPFLKASAADPAARTKILRTLETARARGYIVIPEGATLEVMNLATSAPDQFQSAIEDLRHEIVMAIQGAYLQLLEGGVGNERGNTSVHKGIAELFQWWLACQACQVIQSTLAPMLVEPNFGRGVGMPTITLGGIDPASVAAELQRFKMGQEIGLKRLSQAQAMAVGGFEEAIDDEDVLTPPQQQGGQLGGVPDMAGMFGGPDDDAGGDPPEPPDPTQDPGVGVDSTDFVQLDGKGGTGRTPSPFDRGAAVSWFYVPGPEPMTFAEWSTYTNPKDHRQGWISKGGRVTYTDPTPKEEDKRIKRGSAEEAIAAALTNPGSLKPEHVERLREHIANLPRDRVREVAKALSLKAGGLKVHLAERIIAKAKGQKQPTFDYGKKAPSDTLTAVVKRYGGIDPKSHAFLTHSSGVKEALEYGVNLGVFKTGGLGFDQIAQELHTAGHIASPDTEHLWEKLKEGAKSLHADTLKDYDAAQEEFYKVQQEAEEYAKQSPENRRRVVKARERGEQKGRAKGVSRKVGDAHEGDGQGSVSPDDFDFGPGLDEPAKPPEVVKPKPDVTSRAGIAKLLADHMGEAQSRLDAAEAKFRQTGPAMAAAHDAMRAKPTAKTKKAYKEALAANGAAADEYNAASAAYWTAMDERRAKVRDAIKTAPKAGAIKFHGMTDPEPSLEMVIDGVTFNWPDTDAGHLTAADTLIYAAENPIPAKLWQATGRVVHSSQRNSADAHWEKEYNTPGFVSAATGGDGMTVLYNGNKANAHIFTHEAGHNLATKVWGSTSPKAGSDYAEAQKVEDPVSTYGANSPGEDFAEAVAEYARGSGERFESFKRSFPKKYAAIHALLKE